MKKIIAGILALSMVLSITACGTDTGSSDTDTKTTTTSQTTTSVETTTTTSAETTTTTEETTTTTVESTTTTTVDTTTETTLEEDNINLSIPTSETMADLDAIFIDIIKSKGYDVNYTSDIIEFSAPQSAMNEIAEEWRNKFNEKYSTQSGEIYSVTINEDYTEMTLYVTENFENSMDALSLLLLMQPMCELQMLTGIAETDIDFTQIVINNDSQEVIQTINIPEDFQE